MARITVLGGTGYAGGHIVSEAAKRGHEVTSVSRTAPASAIDGVRYLHGSVLDANLLSQALADADVVVSAVAPRGELEGRIEEAVAGIAAAAQQAGVRLGVIGGAGSLHVSADGPRLYDTEVFPEAYLPEARAMGAVLDALRVSPQALDWFLVCPAVGFGGYAPGEATGKYRVGGDVLLADDQGVSFISGADLAVAIVDEIETPRHRRQRFTVAY